MRFRFRGDLDCPDWILAEMSVLSRITSIKMKILVNQVAAQVTGSTIDYAKVDKITSDAKLSIEEMKAAIAALTFIITSAVKNECPSEILNDELQQLGLPKELGTSLCKVYADKKEQIQQYLDTKKLSFPTLENTEWKIETENGLEVKLLLTVKDPDSGKVTDKLITVTSDKFRVLLNELRDCEQVMANFMSSIEQAK